MMKDCVYKQAAIDALKGLPTWYGDAGCLPFGDPQPPMEALLYPDDAVSAIENLPLADVEPVRHGRWIKMSDADGAYWACSECGEAIPRVSDFDPQFDLFPIYESIDKTNYCPSCGARMDGEVNDDR